MAGQGESRAWIMGKEAFERRMPHHDGIKALWETKWKFPVSISISVICLGTRWLMTVVHQERLPIP